MHNFETPTHEHYSLILDQHKKYHQQNIAQQTSRANRNDFLQNSQEKGLSSECTMNLCLFRFDLEEIAIWQTSHL